MKAILQNIKQSLVDKEQLGANLFFLYTLVYVFSSSGSGSLSKTALLMVAITVVTMFAKHIYQTIVWYVLLALLLLDLATNYYTRANHHFLLVYLIMAYIIFLRSGNYEIFTMNVKWLLFILLFFSSLQKLISPEFISGNFYYYMINTGKFFKILLPLDQNLTQAITSNHAMIKALGNQDPNLLGSITLKNTLPNIASISKFFAWVTVILEFLTGALIVWKPHRMVTHILFILLILGIFLTRMENGFMALLCISGYWLSNNHKVRILYTIMTALFISMTISKIGFY